MVYIREPLPLEYSTPVKIRMGRTTLSLQAKRSWTAAMRSFVFGSNPAEEQANELEIASQNGCPTPNDFMNLLANINNLPPEKSAGNGEDGVNGGNGNGPNFLNHRSYTIRTINEGSIDGVDFDGNDEGGEEGNGQRRTGAGSSGRDILTGASGGERYNHDLFPFGSSYDENIHNRIFLNQNINGGGSNRSSSQQGVGGVGGSGREPSPLLHDDNDSINNNHNVFVDGNDSSTVPPRFTTVARGESGDDKVAGGSSSSGKKSSEKEDIGELKTASSGNLAISPEVTIKKSTATLVKDLTEPIINVTQQPSFRDIQVNKFFPVSSFLSFLFVAVS
jgi:hypothetical protein